MKTILLLLATALSSLATDIRFAWDPSPTTGVTNYVLYAHTNTLSTANLTNAMLKAYCGTNTTGRLENLRSGSTLYFVVTAMKNGIQSDPSNQLIIEVPVEPAGARVVVIEYGITLTNFVDTGFFRLRIP